MFSGVAVDDKTSCCDDDCPVKNPLIPCSKNCGCYMRQAVADLKINVKVPQKISINANQSNFFILKKNNNNKQKRCDALKKLCQSTEWSINSSASEEQLLCSCGISLSSSSSSNLVGGIVARELISRRRDLASMRERWSRVNGDHLDVADALSLKVSSPMHFYCFLSHICCKDDLIACKRKADSRIHKCNIFLEVMTLVLCSFFFFRGLRMRRRNWCKAVDESENIVYCSIVIGNEG